MILQNTSTSTIKYLKGTLKRVCLTTSTYGSTKRSRSSQNVMSDLRLDVGLCLTYQPLLQER